MFRAESFFHKSKNRFESSEECFVDDFNRDAIDAITEFQTNKDKLILNIHGYVGNGTTSMMFMLASQVFNKVKYSSPHILYADEYAKNIDVLIAYENTNSMINNPYLFIDIVQYLDPYWGYDHAKASTFNHLLFVISQRIKQKRKTVITADRSIAEFEFLKKSEIYDDISKWLLETEIKKLSAEEGFRAVLFFCKKFNFKYKSEAQLYKEYLLDENEHYLNGSLRGVEGFVNKQIALQKVLVKNFK